MKRSRWVAGIRWARFARAAAGALLGAAGAIGTAHAAAGDVVNLNPGFAVDLAGWANWVSVYPDASGATIAWSPVDLQGEPGSGSVIVSGPAGAYTLYACLPADFLWQQSRSIRFEVDTGSLGTHSRVQASVVFGFTGDAGETDGCVGPATDSVEAVDAWLDTPGVVRHISPSTFVTRAGPVVTLLVTVHKFDAGAVFIDNVRLIPDGEIPFLSDFE